jgi:hypothetical protein
VTPQDSMQTAIYKGAIVCSKHNSPVFDRFVAKYLKPKPTLTS